MAKTIWKGSIAFGLVNIPVKLYSAAEVKEVDLHLLDKRDMANIRYMRVNEQNGKEVDWKDIIKGAKLNGRYVPLEDKDFDKITPEKTRRIQIAEFIEEKEVDPIYYISTYYAEPDGPGSERPYVLLRKAIQKSGLVALGSFVMRNKEYLCIVRVFQGALVVSKVHYESELRPISGLKVPSAQENPSGAEVDMAISLIRSLSAPFNIKKYKDEYTIQLKKIIKNKDKGIDVPVPKTVIAKPEVMDLLSQLKESLRAPVASNKKKTTKPRKTTKRRTKI